ncbi:GIY-YIG nuclease family protein [Candidatus Gracilibacteria bacterium]|nr:GIY-YIG nuclease family protein [Candidatus Gracilibacteria bacterium]MCF7819033.1 GIY-YIG nuclease family protein [Candidatus Gracilibacteria bacterium]
MKSIIKKPCVYILQGKRFYVGSTQNLNQRIEQHKNKNCYTTKRIGEWKLVRVISCKTMKEALSLERKIKKSGHPERWCKDSSAG